MAMKCVTAPQNPNALRIRRCKSKEYLLPCICTSVAPPSFITLRQGHRSNTRIHIIGEKLLFNGNTVPAIRWILSIPSSSSSSTNPIPEANFSWNTRIGCTRRIFRVIRDWWTIKSIVCRQRFKWLHGWSNLLGHFTARKNETYQLKWKCSRKRKK